MDEFYGLAEPNRRSIVELLAANGELSATAISQKFKKITSAAVSQHLRVLKDLELVRVEKRAQQRIYSLNPKAIRKIEQWAQEMADNYDILNVLINKT